MKYTGRATLLIFTITVSIIESFFEKVTLSSVSEAMFFAVVAYLAGSVYDKSVYYKKMAETNEKQIFDLIRYSPEPLLIYHNEEIVFVNQKAEELMQLNSREIVGKSIFSCIVPQYHEIVRERMKKIQAGQKVSEILELQIYGPQQKIIDVEIASSVIEYQNKRSIEVLLRDITKRKRMEESARKNEALFHIITENSTDIICYIKANGDYEYISPSCEQLLGYQQDELKGKSVFRFLHRDEFEFISELHLEAINSTIDHTTLSHRFKKENNTYIWLETNVRTVRNTKMELEGFVTVSRDITERKVREEKLLEKNELLQYLSVMDGLTDIPNRRYFEKTLQDEWNRAKRSGAPLSVLMIDIDNFKQFNDYYGHQAGDMCIQKIAKVIKKTLKRPGDFCARYGGEEFIVLLPETGEEGAAVLAGQIVQNVRNLKISSSVSTFDKYVTVSIGSATVIPSDNLTAKVFINSADKSLYLAKKSGKNQVKVYNDGENP